MLRLITKRTAQGILVLWGLATLVFVIIRVIGNPAALMLPLDATPEAIEALTVQYGLAEPMWNQYIDYLQALIQRDLGRSLWMRAPVTELIMNALPMTLRLAALVIVLAFLIGVGLGWLGALRPDSWADRLVTWLSFTSISLPDFWFGLVLMSVMAVQLGLLPTSGVGSWQHYVLPIITLLARPVGRLAHATRSGLARELSKQYVVTARSKGLRGRAVIGRHALKNSLAGVVTLTADEAIDLISGAVVVETVFGWPGIGLLLIQSIQNRDPNLVVGIVLVISTFVVVLNFVVDLLYAVLDPRVRTQ